MAVTISDVARAAGVGVGTVSRVLNNSRGVKETTRKKVLNTIAELNYSPDPIARSMITRRTRSLGVIVPFVTHPFSVEVLRGLTNSAARLGYELVIYNVEDNTQRDDYFVQLPMRRRVDGLIIISLTPPEEVALNLRKIGLTTILVDAYSPHLTSLVVNNVEGTYRAITSLIKKGHRRIGFINGLIEGNFKFNQANEHLVGVHRAFSEAGIVFDPALMVTSDWSREGGKKAAHELLELANPPTAIFASSDVQAVGVLEAARSLNLSVPEDLSVMGFDGLELSEVLELSTVQQPMLQMGEISVVKLMEHLENEHKPPELVRFDTWPVERRTTASPGIMKSL